MDQWTLVAGAGPCAGFKVHVPWMDAGGSSSSIAAGGGGQGTRELRAIHLIRQGLLRLGWMLPSSCAFVGSQWQSRREGLLRACSKLSSRSLEDPLDAGGFYAMDGPPSPALSAPSASPLILVHEWNQAPRRARTELAAGIERAGKSSSHHQARSNPPEVPPCTTTCTTCTTSWLGCCHRSATMGHAASPNPCARPPASDSRLMRRHCRGSSSWDSSTQSRPAPIAAQGHRHPSPRPQQAATAGPARLEPMAHEGGPWDPGRHVRSAWAMQLVLYEPQKNPC